MAIRTVLTLLSIFLMCLGNPIASQSKRLDKDECYINFKFYPLVVWYRNCVIHLDYIVYTWWEQRNIYYYLSPRVNDCRLWALDIFIITNNSVIWGLNLWFCCRCHYPKPHSVRLSCNQRWISRLGCDRQSSVLPIPWMMVVSFGR